MFTITIQCKDINEFANISAMLRPATVPYNVPVNAFPAPTSMTTTEVKEREEMAKGEATPLAKKSKAKKEKAVEVVAEETPAEVEAEPVKTAQVSKEDVAAALQKVNTAKGLAVARQILADFECQRISDVTPEVYSDFVHACEQACL